MTATTQLPRVQQIPLNNQWKALCPETLRMKQNNKPNTSWSYTKAWLDSRLATVGHKCRKPVAHKTTIANPIHAFIMPGDD